MKSQRYRAYNNWYWKRLRQKIHALYKYYKNGLKYGDHLLPFQDILFLRRMELSTSVGLGL